MSSSLVVYYASAALAVQHQTAVDEEGALGVNTINTEVGTVDSGGTNGYNGVGWRVLDDSTNTVFRPDVGDDFATTGISVTPYYVYPASVNISYYYSKNAADSGILADDAASANTLAGTSGNRTGYNILNYELGAVNPGNNATTGGMGAEWEVYDAGTNNTQGPYTDPTILDALGGLVGPFYAYPISNPAYISYYETRYKQIQGLTYTDANIVTSVLGDSSERIGFNSKNYTLGIAVSGVDGTAKGDASTNSTTRWDVYNSGGSRVYQRQIAIPLTYGDGTNRYYAFQSPAIISYYMNLAAADAGAIATDSKNSVSLGSNNRIGFTSISTLGAVDSGAGGGVFGPPGVTGWIIAKIEDAIAGSILSDGTTVGNSSYNILADTYYYVCPNFAYISYYPSLAAAQAGRDAGDCGDTDNVQPSAPYSAQRIGYSTTSYTVSDPGATFGSSGGATMNNDTWSGFRYKPSDGTYESVGPFTGNNPEDITNGGTDLGPFYLYVNTTVPPTSQANISYYLTDLEAQAGSVNTDSNNIQDITGNTGSTRIGFNTTNFTPGTVDVGKGDSGPLGTNFWRVIGSDGYVITNGQTQLPVEVSSSNDLATEFPASSAFYLYPAPTPAAISYYPNYNDMDSGITSQDHTDTSTLSGTSTKRIGYSLAQYTVGSVVQGGLAGPVGTTSWEVYLATSPPERLGTYTTSAVLGSPGNYYAFPTPAKISYYANQSDAQSGLELQNQDGLSIVSIGGTSTKRKGYNSTDYIVGTVTNGETNSTYVGWYIYTPLGTGTGGIFGVNGVDGNDASMGTNTGEFYAYPVPLRAFISYYPTGAEAMLAASVNSDGLDVSSAAGGGGFGRVGYNAVDYYVGIVGSPDSLADSGITQSNQNGWDVYNTSSQVPQLRGDKGTNLVDPFTYGASGPFFYLSPTPVVAYISYYATSAAAIAAAQSQNDGEDTSSVGGANNSGRVGYNAVSYIIGNVGNPDTNIDSGNAASNGTGWNIYSSPAGNLEGNTDDPNNPYLITDTRTPGSGPFYYASPTPVVSTPVISYYNNYADALAGQQAGSGAGDNSSTSPPEGLSGNRIGYKLDEFLGNTPDNGTTGNSNGDPYWIVYDAAGQVVNGGLATGVSSLPVPGSYYAFPAPAAISYYLSAGGKNGGVIDEDNINTSAADGNQGGRLGFSLNYTVGVITSPNGLGSSGYEGTLSWTIYDSANNQISGTKPLNDITLVPTTKEGQYYFAVPVPNGIVYYASESDALSGTNPIASSTSYTVETQGGTSIWKVSSRSIGTYSGSAEYNDGDVLDSGTFDEKNYAYYLYPAPVVPPPATQANISYYSSKTGGQSGVNNTDYDNIAVVEGDSLSRIGFNSANFLLGTVDSTPVGQSTGNDASSWYVYNSAGTLLSGAYSEGDDLSLMVLSNNSYFYVFQLPTLINISYYANSTDALAGQEAQDGLSIIDLAGTSTVRKGLNYVNYIVGNVDRGVNEANITNEWSLFDSLGVDFPGPFNLGNDLEGGAGTGISLPVFAYPYTAPPPPASQANISYYLTDIAALSGYDSTDYSNIVTISTGSGRIGFNSANFLLGTVDSTPSGQSTGPPGTSSWYVYDDTRTLLSSAYSAGDLSGLPHNAFFYVFPAATQANISYYASAADAADGRTANDNTSFSTGDVNGLSNKRIGFNSADFLLGISDPGAGENGIDNNASGFSKSWYVILANGTTHSSPLTYNTDLPSFIATPSAYYFAYPISTQISYYLNYTNANLGRIANDNATVATLQGASGQRIGYVISYSLGTLDSDLNNSTTGNDNTSPYWIVYTNNGTVVSSGDAMSPGILTQSGSYYAFPAPAFISYYLSVIDKNLGFNQNDHNDTTVLGAYRSGFSLNYTVGDTTSGSGTAGYSGTLSWTIYNSTNTSIGSKNLNDTSLVPSTKQGQYYYAVFNPNGIYYCATKAEADGGGVTRISQSSSYLIGSAGGFSSWKISSTSVGDYDENTTYNVSDSITLDDGSGASPDPINYIYYLYPATAPAIPSFISYYLNYADAVNGRTADNGAGDNSDTSTLGGLSGLRIGYALTYSLGSTDDGTNGNDNAPQGRYWIVYDNNGTVVNSGNATAASSLTASGSYYAFPAPAAISYYLSVDDKDAGRAAGDRIDTFSAIASSRSGVRLGFSLNYIVGVITSPNDKGDSGYSGTAFWTIYDSTGTILSSAAIKPLNDTSLVPSTKQGQYYYAVVVPNGIVYYANQANADAGTSSIASSTSYTVATQGSTSSWKMSTRSTGPDPSTTYDTGTTLDDGISSGVNYAYYLYPATTPTPAPCFLEGTTILCLVKGVQTYVPVEEIRTGTLVKTAMDGFKPVKVIGTRTIENPGTDERLKDRLYKCSTSKYPELKEDLYITGCHSILVDTLTDEQRADMLTKQESIYITGDKYRLLACSDERAEPWASEGAYQIWHFALDHEDEKKNYGVYANGGLLVETCCLKRMKEKSYMILA